MDPDDQAKYKVASESVRFTMDSSFQYVKLRVHPRRRAQDVEVSKASYLGIALIALLTLAFLNQSKVSEHCLSPMSACS